MSEKEQKSREDHYGIRPQDVIIPRPDDMPEKVDKGIRPQNTQLPRPEEPKPEKPK